MSAISAKFNKAFRDANRTRARYRVLMGGAGAGKSANVARDFILKLSDTAYRGANLLVVRKTETSCRSSVFEELLAAIQAIFGEAWERYWAVRQEPLSLTCRLTGARILFRGMADAAARERLKSLSFRDGKLTFIWCEEATELSEGDFEILDDRLRGDLSALNPNLYYQITLTFNPVSAHHWLKRRFFDAPPSKDVFCHRSTYRDNAFLDKGYGERMARRAVTDPEGYAVYALGEWGAGGQGLILTHWRVEALTEELSRYDSAWMAQDFGFNHANCLLLVAVRDGGLFVLRELYVRGRDTAEIIEMAKAAGFPTHLPMYCDSAEPDRIRMWRKAGFRAEGVKKDKGSVSGQIECLKSRPLTVNASCVNVLDELSSWRWLPDGVGGGYTDIPTPEHDDAMAALRYATEPLRRPAFRLLPKGLFGV